MGYRFPFRWSASSFWLLLLLFAPSLVALPAAGQTVPPLELNYHLRLARPTTHLVEVQIDVARVTSPSLDFVLPAWSPGRYAIYDFAKNVQEFEALDGQGRALEWTQRDKQTWHVDTPARAGGVRVRYRVYANDLNGSFSQFDSTHLNLNGASVYMYVEGHKADSLTLTLEDLPDEAPAWKIISGFSPSTEQKTFSVPSYDRLIDTPLELCGECQLDEFRDHDKTFRVLIHNYTAEEIDARDAANAPTAVLMTGITDQLKKIVHSEMAMMPAPDFDTYTFIFHFAPEISLGDGMEHLNSTQIITRGSLDVETAQDAVETAAHEFFHLWNVKRLRPAALGPFDYTKENYTRSLWFAEGVTSYYAYVQLLRSGIWSREVFLNHLADEIRTLELEPGRELMSAESSSFHAWFYDRAPQMQETNFPNSTISYYNKGALLGMLLDLEIRSRTHGRKSLDDLMRSLYQSFYAAPPATIYGPGHGYEEKDLLEATNALTGSDFTEFFNKYVAGTEPLPCAQTLALAGLELQTSVASDATPWIGISAQQEDRGLRITSVRPGSGADLGGLSAGDLLLNVDELSLATTALKDRLKIYPPGAEVPFTVERHNRRERITVKLSAPVKDQYSIDELPAATAEQKAIGDAWLHVED
ncbi:MAG TPA: PDZ domain-containing protein [Terriglobia bacterium]|nr:PDZ domain-containing protein [Terriglobia bacterium]